jgi:hypothetical protein
MSLATAGGFTRLRHRCREVSYLSGTRSSPSSSQRKLGSILILLLAVGSHVARHGGRIHSPSASLSRSFVPLSGGRPTSLCLSKEKIGKRKDTPQTRPCGLPPSGVRESGPGFSTVRPCTGENSRASCARPCGLFRPRLTASEGPHGRAERARPARKSEVRQIAGCSPLLLNFGPRVERRRTEGSARRVARMDAREFGESTGTCLAEPRRSDANPPKAGA